MPAHTVDELAQLLVRSRLLTPDEATQQLAEASPLQSDVDAFLNRLEAKNLLTPYQTSAIRRGEIDALVLGDYKLLYRNASGSFARVFRAESLTDGRMVGLKLLRQRWAKDDNVVAQFRREALLCKRMQHPNIVPIYDVGREGDQHFFTMEFIEGGNLRDFINIRKKLSPVEATRCVLHIAEGLAYAIGLGITHRDLKLTNVLMGTNGVAKLVDFGLAGDETLSNAMDDEANQRALEYAAIERGTGAPDNDPRTDLFFTGAIYYELLTGTPPYKRTRDRDARKRLSRYSNVRSLHSLDPSLPAPVIAVVERLMMINPAQRYQSAAELIQDLRSVLRQLDPQTAPNGKPSDDGDRLPSVLCVEDRAKQQDLLRKHLSKHDYRVLILANVWRAIDRIKSDPPDCVVLMGESIGHDVADAYRELVDLSKREALCGVLILSKAQKHLTEECLPTGSTRVVVQPLSIRELRKTIQKLLRFRHAEQPPPEIDDGTDDSAVARL